MFAMSAQMRAGLVGEHDDLDAVVRHALGHAPVGGHHAAAEVLALALDGERAAAVPDPVGELRRRVLAQPGDEELEDLLVLHRVAVGRVGDVDVVLVYVFRVLGRRKWRTFPRMASMAAHR